MIERKFIAQKKKEFQIQEFIAQNLKRVGHSHTKLQRTPLGEKIIIHASRPGLIIGRKGQNIKKLTKTLKKKFDLENPQIEISEVENINLDAQIVAERIANTLERFGTTKFKGVGHKVMTDVMDSGALGIEIIISGKIPSARAKSWRFYSGYLKKCGDIALSVGRAYTIAQLKTGIVGVKVSIMPSDIRLPDDVKLLKKKVEVVEELSEKEGKKVKPSNESEKDIEKPKVSQKEEMKKKKNNYKKKKEREKENQKRKRMKKDEKKRTKVDE